MKVRLGDIFEIGSGGTPAKSHPEYYGGSIPWVKTGDLKTEYLNEVEDYITEEGLKNSSAKIYEEDTVLIAMYGATIGATSILKMSASTNQACAAFKKNNKVFSEYLYYFLKSQRGKFVKDGVGGAQPNISAGYLKKVEMELASLDEQRKIIDILDKISDIMHKKNQEIQLLDDLVRARFVEMFGDPVNNEKGWITDTVDNLCIEIYGGGTPSKVHPEYYEDGDIPWVSSKDMKTDILTDSQIKINQMGVENSTARMVPVNSVIVVIRSGILKHTLPVAINAVPITVNQDLKVFIPSERILTRFLAVQFKMHEKDILTGVRAVTADNIEFNSLKQRKLIVPSIELQQEYVLFLEQVDKLKVEVQKALDETQKLFDSLMQQYFG